MKKVGIGFIIIGVIFLVLSVNTFKESRDFRARSEKVTATITHVERNGTRKHRHYDVNYVYEINGKQIEGFKRYKSHKSVGDTITVWYDKNDISRISFNNKSYKGTIFLAVSAAVFLYYGIGWLFRKPEDENP